MYTFQREEDLAPLIDIIRPLRISNILENVAQLRSAIQTLAVRGRPKSDYYTGPGPLPQEILDRELSAQPCGKCAWIYYGMSYGPPHIRHHKLSIIDKEFLQIPGARRIDPSTIPADNYFWSRDRVASAQPDLEELLWTNWVPNGAHIAFSPVSPIRGTDATALLRLAKARHAEHGIDLFPAFCVGLREMHLIVEIVFDKRSAASRASALACMRDMVDDAARLGYGEYRTHVALFDQVAGTYGWNDKALMRLQERVKDALDPRGVLAPGKSGVWPERYRGRGWEMGKGEERSEGDGVRGESGEVKL